MKGRGEVGAMDEVSVPKGGMEEKRVNFWWVHLGIGGRGKDVSDCDGQAVSELIDDYEGSDVGRIRLEHCHQELMVVMSIEVWHQIFKI